MKQRKSIIEQSPELAERYAAGYLARAGIEPFSKEQVQKPIVFEGTVCVQHANGAFQGRTLVFPKGTTQGVELSRWLRETAGVSADSAPELADRVRITIEKL